MGKRKANIFTVAESVTNWLEASSHSPADSESSTEGPNQVSLSQRLEERLQLVGLAFNEADTGRSTPILLQPVGGDRRPSNCRPVWEDNWWRGGGTQWERGQGDGSPTHKWARRSRGGGKTCFLGVAQDRWLRGLGDLVIPVSRVPVHGLGYTGYWLQVYSAHKCIN